MYYKNNNNDDKNIDIYFWERLSYEVVLKRN